MHTFFSNIVKSELELEIKIKSSTKDWNDYQDHLTHFTFWKQSDF